LNFNKNLKLVMTQLMRILGTILVSFGTVFPSSDWKIANLTTSENLPAVAEIDNRCVSPLAAEDRLKVDSLSNPSETDRESDDLCQTDVVTKDTICQTHLTIPSLWWADEQFGNKLLENWLAYPNEKRIDLVVNRQRWGLMDYYERYAFVHRMGVLVRGNGETGEAGYDLRVFNRQEPDICLAAYACRDSNCQLQIKDFGLRSSASP